MYSSSVHTCILCAAYNRWCTRVFCFADESVLRDLKGLLLEAKQKVPPFLDQMGLLSDELLDLGGTLFSKCCGMVICIVNEMAHLKFQQFRCMHVCKVIPFHTYHHTYMYLSHSCKLPRPSGIMRHYCTWARKGKGDVFVSECTAYAYVQCMLEFQNKWAWVLHHMFKFWCNFTYLFVHICWWLLPIFVLISWMVKEIQYNEYLIFHW